MCLLLTGNDSAKTRLAHYVQISAPFFMQRLVSPWQRSWLIQSPSSFKLRLIPDTKIWFFVHLHKQLQRIVKSGKVFLHPAVRWCSSKNLFVIARAQSKIPGLSFFALQNLGFRSVINYADLCSNPSDIFFPRPLVEEVKIRSFRREYSMFLVSIVHLA